MKRSPQSLQHVSLDFTQAEVRADRVLQPSEHYLRRHTGRRACILAVTHAPNPAQAKGCHHPLMLREHSHAVGDFGRFNRHLWPIRRH